MEKGGAYTTTTRRRHRRRVLLLPIYFIPSKPLCARFTHIYRKVYMMKMGKYYIFLYQQRCLFYIMWSNSTNTHNKYNLYRMELRVAVVVVVCALEKSSLAKETRAARRTDAAVAAHSIRLYNAIVQGLRRHGAVVVLVWHEVRSRTFRVREFKAVRAATTITSPSHPPRGGCVEKPHVYNGRTRVRWVCD